MSKKQMTNSKMSIKVQFEIGHKAVLKAKKGADNFTHDWELYVKGVDKADISSYIEKIVFNLHESFPKPKRTFKEPPFVLKESGYAGFILPIDIHFKNRTMQTYQYDIDLQPSGPPVHKSEIKTHIFENSSEDFRQKLLKGGGILHGNLNEERIRIADTEFQHKLKNSSNSGSINSIHESSSKKSHKIRPEKNKVQNFENIFGKPITKTASTPPTIINSGANINVLKSSSQESKIKSSSVNNSQLSTNLSKISNQGKPDKVLSNPNLLNVKDKSEINEKSEKKEKHKHSSHKDKEKTSKDGKDRKDDKHERREDRERKKDKSHSKERDRSTEKSAKSRIESPQRKKPRISSPVSAIANAARKSPVRSLSSTSKEETKNKSSTQPQILQNSSQIQSQHHPQNSVQHQSSDLDKKSNSSSSSSSKKSKKEKKSHEKDKERESRKDRENKNQKDFDQASRSSSTVSYQGNSGVAAVIPAGSNNNEINKNHKPDLGSAKSSSKSKIDQKIVSESTTILPSPNTTNATSSSKKSSEKHDNEEKRHKHKKKDKSKDKDKDKNREKEGSSAKEKDKKRDKKMNKDDSKRNKEEDMGSTATSNSNLGPSESLHDSLFNSDHESHHSDADKIVHHSDSSNHTFAGNISKSKIPSQNNVNNPPKLYSTNTITTSQISSNDNVTTVVEKKEKKSKDQKIEKEEKKRKRKSREGTVDSNASSSGNNINLSDAQSKIPKKNVTDQKILEKQSTSSLLIQAQPQPPLIPLTDSFRAPSVSSGSSISCSSVPISTQHHLGVSRSIGNSANAANSGFDLDYISELKELQEKIMTLQDNNELQKVVEIIAATGRFEITSKTFDFDLCALDRNTIQRLHVIV